MSSVYLKYLLISSMYLDISRTWGLTSRPTWSPPYVICWWPDPATTSAKRRTTNVRTCPMAGCSPGGRQLYRCAWTQNFCQKYRCTWREIQECLCNQAAWSSHPSDWLLHLSSILRQVEPKSFLSFYLIILSWKFSVGGVKAGNCS